MNLVFSGLKDFSFSTVKKKMKMAKKVNLKRKKDFSSFNFINGNKIL